MANLDFMENYKTIRRRFFKPQRPKKPVAPIEVIEPVIEPVVEKKEARESIREIYFKPHLPRIKGIVALVADHYGVTPQGISSPRRTGNLILPRHVVFYLAREVTAFSLSQIGNLMGGRDHSTIHHGCTKIERLMAKDPEFKSTVESLLQTIAEASDDVDC